MTQPPQSEQPNPTPVVFIWTLHGDYGGTETLIIRAARWLASHGHAVLIVCNEGAAVPHYQKTGAALAVLNAFELQHPLHTPEEFRGLLLRLSRTFPAGVRPHIVCFDPAGLFLGESLAGVMGGKVFCHLVHPTILDALPAALLDRMDALGRLLGLNLGCVEEIRGTRGVALRNTPLFPAAVEEMEPPTPLPATPRILSIARFVHDKRYLFALIRAMPALRAIAPALELDIIGYGPLQDALEAEARRLDAQGYIHFVGAVPPERLGEYYERCSIYVGMGTTALYAARHARPSVVVFIGSDAPVTPGLLQDLPGLNVGERLPCVPTQPLGEFLARLLTVREFSEDAARTGYRYIEEHFTLDNIMPRMLSHMAAAPDGPVPVERDYLTQMPSHPAQRWAILRHHVVQLLRAQEQVFPLVRGAWLARRRAALALRRWTRPSQE